MHPHRARRHSSPPWLTPYATTRVNPARFPHALRPSLLIVSLVLPAPQKSAAASAESAVSAAKAAQAAAAGEVAALQARLAAEQEGAKAAAAKLRKELAAKVG